MPYIAECLECHYFFLSDTKKRALDYAYAHFRLFSKRRKTHSREFSIDKVRLTRISQEDYRIARTLADISPKTFYKGMRGRNLPLI